MAILFFLTFLKIYVIINYKIKEEKFMENLIKWLNERTKEYDEGHPTVSDKEWDEKYFELVKLEEQFRNA